MTKVSQITVSLGVTRSLGKNTFEFARIDITNRADLDTPLEVGSKEYRTAHRELVEGVEAMLEKAEAQVVPAE